MEQIDKYINKFKSTTTKKRVIEIPNEVKEFFEKNSDINSSNINEFVSTLKILLDYIKSNFASINYINLGLADYKKSGTLEQWNKFYLLLLDVYSNNDIKNSFENFIKDSLHGYRKTGTVSPIIFVLSNGKYPIINGITKEAIKILGLDKNE